MAFGQSYRVCLAENLTALEVVALQPSIPFGKGAWENKKMTVYFICTVIV